MSDIIKSFGYNAGKIWNVLRDEGPQVQTKLLKTTGLRNEEFYGAINPTYDPPDRTEKEPEEPE